MTYFIGREQRRFLCLLAITVAAMFQSHAALSESNIPFWKRLSKYSFGRLDRRLPTYCDRREPGVGSLQEKLTNKLVGLLFSPIQGALVYDDVLVSEQLQDQFASISDTGIPPVVVVSRNDHEIVFFYGMGLVIFSEVQHAASKYCSYNNHRALYEGSARHCVRGPGINGALTEVISAFSCR